MACERLEQRLLESGAIRVAILRSAAGVEDHHSLQMWRVGGGHSCHLLALLDSTHTAGELGDCVAHLLGTMSYQRNIQPPEIEEAEIRARLLSGAMGDRSPKLES